MGAGQTGMGEAVVEQAQAKAVVGNTPFSLSWGQEDLFPCGVWGSAPQTLGENKRLVSKDEHHALVMLGRRRQSRDRARGQCAA